MSEMVDSRSHTVQGKVNHIWDKQAIYRGHFSGRRVKGQKVNPIYSDSSSISNSSSQDINGNMNSVCVVTYESFPKNKHSKENSNHVRYANGNPTQNGHLQNGHAINGLGPRYGSLRKSNDPDPTIDVNRNKLKVSKSEPTKDKVWRDDIYTVVKIQGNRPVLLGPGEGLTDNVDNVDKPEEKTNEQYGESEGLNDQNGAIKFGHTGQQEFLAREDELYDKVPGELNEPDNVTYDKVPDDINVQENGINDTSAQRDINDGNTDTESGKVNQHYMFLDDSDIEVVIEDRNTDNYENITNLMTQNLIPAKDKRNNYENLNYENVAFECNEKKQELDNEATDPKGKRNPLIHQKSVDGDSEHNSSEVNVIDEIIARIPEKDKKSSATEILTEAIVHVNENQESGVKRGQSKGQQNSGNQKCHSLHQTASDWPEIDTLVRKGRSETVTEAHGEKSVHFAADTYKHARSVSDVIKATEQDIAQESSHTQNNETGKSAIYSKNVKKQQTSGKTVTFSTDGSTRTLKSILTNSCNGSQCSHSESCSHHHSDAESEIHEVKSVKFSKDTVFHENKSAKYKQEKVNRINLREIYNGKIFSESAVAKMNPIYTEDDGKGEGGTRDGSMTDDEKLAYQISLKKALKMSKKGENLNQPSYMEKYLILKAHGLKVDDNSIEQLPEWMERPTYDRLIQRTLAKERRKCCVKWTFVILTVLTITAVATVLGIYFRGGF